MADNVELRVRNSPIIPLPGDASDEDDGDDEDGDDDEGDRRGG